MYQVNNWFTLAHKLINVLDSNRQSVIMGYNNTKRDQKDNIP